MDQLLVKSEVIGWIDKDCPVKEYVRRAEACKWKTINYPVFGRDRFVRLQVCMPQR